MDPVRAERVDEPPNRGGELLGVLDRSILPPRDIDVEVRVDLHIRDREQITPPPEGHVSDDEIDVGEVDEDLVDVDRM